MKKAISRIPLSAGCGRFHLAIFVKEESNEEWATRDGWDNFRSWSTMLDKAKCAEKVWFGLGRRELQCLCGRVRANAYPDGLPAGMKF